MIRVLSPLALVVMVAMGFVIISCSTEPNIISQDEYIASQSKLYIYSSSAHEKKIVPTVSTAIINSGIYMSIKKEDVEEYSSNGIYLSLFVDDLSLKRTDFNYDDYSNRTVNHWAMYGYRLGIYDLEHDNSYFTLTELDQVNKTISGEFIVNRVEGFFDKLPYSGSLNSDFIYQEANLDIFDYSGFTYYTGSYKTNEITQDSYGGFRIKFPYKRTLSCSFDNSTNGTYSFTTDDDISFSSPYGGVYYDSVQSGTYTISDYQIYGHKYKKYTFNLLLSASTYTNKSIQINNASILVY